jgi:hypothetical protein
MRGLKRITYFICCMIFALPAFANPAFIQKAVNSPNGEHPEYFDINGVSEGSFLVVVIRLTDAGTTTVTSTGLSWTRDSHYTNPSNGITIDIHSAPNVSAGTHTINMTKTGGSAFRAVCLEYSGVSGPAHKTSSDDGYGTAINSGPITTTIDNCLIICGGATDSDHLGWSAGTGFTMRTSGTGEPEQKLNVEDRVGDSGTYSGTFTINTDLWVSTIVAYPSGASQTEYYVSTTGSGSDCTDVYPCSLSTANSSASAGSTVYMYSGTYDNDGYINPTNSGSSGNVITYQNYGGDVIISGQTYAVYLSGKDYIKIDGIDAEHCTHFLWMQSGSDYNEITNCSFDDNDHPTTWVEHSVIYGSDYNWIHNNQFSKGGSPNNGSGDDKSSVLDIGDESSSTYESNYNLIEDNVFFHGGHHVIGLESRFNTIRNNYFHNEAWYGGYGNRILYNNSPSSYGGFNLIEGNRWGYSAESVDNGYVGAVVLSSPSNIFRYNLIYHNEGYGIGLGAYSGYTNSSNNRIYNNTIVNSGLGGGNPAVFVTNSGGQTPTGNVFKNNLYYENPSLYGGQSYESQTYVNEFNGDISGDPLFVNFSTTPPADKTDNTIPDLNISSGSPVINNGVALTTVAVADTGK